MASRLSTKEKLRSFFRISRATAVLFCGVCVYRADERFYNSIVMPLATMLDPENAHLLAIKALKWGLVGGQAKDDSNKLHTNVWGMNFKNPVGMAAGFDKQGEAVEGLHKLGFSFVEIGSVTPEPQTGNPKPRVFRLWQDNAVINRYGFNSVGHEVVWERIKKVKSKETFNGIVGINLGKNKNSDNAVKDYVKGIEKFHDVADYFVINVSSPNTPGLRTLQSKENLVELLRQVNQARSNLKASQPLLLKLAPDLSDTERQNIADVILSKETAVDGLVLCNTTTERPDLTSPLKTEGGGLSGAPLTNKSTEMIADMYRRTHGKIPIIGVGGVFSGQDAFDKIKAGASLVQLYTSYAYHGPPIIEKVKRELQTILDQHNISSIAEIVGEGDSIERKISIK